MLPRIAGALVLMLSASACAVIYIGDERPERQHWCLFNCDQGAKPADDAASEPRHERRTRRGRP